MAFVTGGLPGERVKIAVDARKRAYLSAHAVTIEEASADRVASICPVFPRCGGCQVLHLRYEAQLAWKRRLVADALARLGGLRDVSVDTVVPSDIALGLRHRNKVSLVTHASGGKIRLGFYAARTHHVVPIEHCPVTLPRLDDAIKGLVGLARDSPQLFDDVHHVVARASATDQSLVVSINSRRPRRELAAATDDIRGQLPGLTGLVASWEPSSANAVFGRRFRTLWGSPLIGETIAGARLRFGIASFFQTNTAMLERIAQRVVEAVDGARRVVDLYCGVGTFGVILGMRGIASTGVESVRVAVGEAAENAAENGVTCAVFECANVATALAGSRGRTLLAGADWVIVDPPRRGCEAEVLAAIAANAVPNILYVSCNPATLARDARLLVDAGYALGSVKPFDMFPQTGSVEVVAEFHRP